MDISWLLLFILILASFRLTRLVVHDKITAFLRRPFIDEITLEENGMPVTYTKIKGRGIQYFFGELLSCTWCSGIWCTAILLLLYVFLPQVGEFIIILLAIAGAAGVIETIVNRMNS
ncbi:DUF1360 domain-containing protein [Bacillus sp. AFS055030]|uniref:DUF1360 domain-containing protein n=1 Tax=Bacillus sp. AFS055030 TaxID=2033507 RepID=UPI000BFC8FB0|nr:DUF1360 domain-containing protein [Bacillus sp. AFS055030]PGL73040.1 hypothetical protein CN925_01965 [Bacillus sp. AFS055030]